MIRRLLCGSLVVFLSYSFDIPVSFSQANFSKHSISSLPGAFWVTAKDVNLDGRLDLVTSADHGLDWWDNTSGFARNFVGTMSRSWSVYAGDLDGDGDVEIVGGSELAQEISVFEKSGGGGYVKYVVETNYELPESIYAADLDGDGDQDIVSCAVIPGHVNWWEKSGNTYTKHFIDSNLARAHSVYPADLDGDGDIDIVAGGTAESRWYENDGNGSFVARNLGSGGSLSVYAADLDGDGDSDILRTNRNNGNVEWFENDGFGRFTGHLIEAAYGDSWSAVAGDIDGDGDLDVAAAGFAPNSIKAWFNLGGGNFDQGIVIDNVSRPRYVYIADLDNDGDGDVAAAIRGIPGPGELVWYEVQGTPFPSIEITSPNGGETLPVGSVFETTWISSAGIGNLKIEYSTDNGGNWNTIINSTENDGSHNWTVPFMPSQLCLIRISEIGGSVLDISDSNFEIEFDTGPSPLVASFEPLSGPIGTEVTITGNNFLGTTLVSFNDVEATFTVDSDSVIRTTVPEGASTGAVKVTNDTGTGTSVFDFTVTDGSTFIFNPTSDAQVKEGKPDTNYGSKETFKVEAGNFSSYLKFNVTGLNGTVTSAKIRLLVLDGGQSGGAFYSVFNNFKDSTTPWDESILTFNNAPVIGGTKLFELGPVAVGELVEVDVTTAINGEGVYSFGIMSESTSLIIYSSKEGTTRPELLLETTIINKAPVAVSDSSSTIQGEQVVIDVLSNDHDSDSEVDVTSVRLEQLPTGGTAVVDSSTGTITYSPEDSFSGVDRFSYRVSDEFGLQSNVAEVVVTVLSLIRSEFSFSASDDSHVNSAERSTNYGDNSDLSVSLDGYSSYLKFQVEGLVGTVSQAVIRLNVVQGGTHGGEIYSTRTTFNKSNTAWNEDQLTYRNIPILLGSALGSLGTVGAGEIVEFDVTDVVDGNGEFSFCMRGGVCVNRDCFGLVAYGSKESLSPPELVVETVEIASGANFKSKLSAATVEVNLTSSQLPDKVELSPNYPNPFNIETNIEYTLPDAGQVRIMIYNLRGQVVRHLFEGYENSGVKRIRWNGRNDLGYDVASGLYFVGLEIGETEFIRKMSLQK